MDKNSHQVGPQKGARIMVQTTSFQKQCQFGRECKQLFSVFELIPKNECHLRPRLSHLSQKEQQNELPSLKCLTEVLV